MSDHDRTAYACAHLRDGSRAFRFCGLKGADVFLSCGETDHPSLDDWRPVGLSHFIGPEGLPASVLTLQGQAVFVRDEVGNWLLERDMDA